jgi:hypothetical protein
MLPNSKAPIACSPLPPVGENFSLIKARLDRLGTNQEARSEDLAQLLKESSKHFGLAQGVLGQYQG